MVVLLVVGAGGLTGPVGVVAAADCTFPTSSTDATGTNVTVAGEPDRVVTLNPSAAQTMWEIGAEEKVVGLSGFASYLDGAENRTNVYPTTSTGVNVEEVINLTPDLVLAPNTIPNDTVEQLRTAGLTVYKFETATDTAFIVEKTRRTGRLVGECEGANDRADRMQAEVATIGEATSGVDRPRVFYDFFGFTAGSGTFIDTIITTAGGENVAAEAGISGYASYSDEIVVANDPEWILLNSDDPTVPDTAAFAGTTAEAEGQNVTVDANYVSQPAPRIVQPMLTLVKALHPAEYQAAKEGVEEIRDEEEEPELPPPAFSITSVTLDRERVELNEQATIVATVSNDGGPGTFEARLYRNDSLKDTEYAEVDGGDSATVRFDHTFSSWGRHVVRVNDRRVGTVVVVKDLDGESGDSADSAASNTTNSTLANTTTEGTPDPPASTRVPTTSGDDRAGSDSTTGRQPTPTDTTAGTGAPTATLTAPPSGAATADATTVRSSGQPGFGVGVAVVGLVATGLAHRRRQ